MKKLLLFVFGGFTLAASAQSSFLLTDPNTGNPASATYYFWVGASDPTLTLEFPVKNTSGSSIASKVKKEVISTQTGQDIYFCYGTNCYTPTTFTSTTVNLTAGQQLPNGNGTYGLRTDFDANGVLGLSVVRYTVYNTANVNDSASVTISYNVTANGIRSNVNPASISTASPNPASNFVNFAYDMNGASNAAIRIYNSLGNLVKVVNLSAGSKNTQVDVSGLEEGFYFYSLISDGKAIGTKRFVITR